MKLEVGKSYVTENGSIAHINKNTNDMGFEYNNRPFGGIIEDRGAAFFTENGIYSLDNQKSGFNIVSEI